MDIVEPRLLEDGGRVVRDDVHAAELLHEHDNDGRECSTAVSGHGEELDEAVPAGGDFFFGFQEDMNVCKSCEY